MSKNPRKSGENDLLMEENCGYHSENRVRTQRSGLAGGRRREADRRRLHHSVHRPLPERGHGHAERRTAAYSGNATDRAEKPGGKEREDPGDHRVPGKADRGAAGRHRSCGDQRRPRRPVPSFPAEADHPRDHRHGEGAERPGGHSVGPEDGKDPGRGGTGLSFRGKGRHDCGGSDPGSL